MRTSPSIAPHGPQQDTYLVLDDFGPAFTARAWRETDEDATDRKTLIHNLLSGEYNKPVRIVAFNIKALGRVVLQNGNGVVAAFHEQFHGLRALLRRVKTVEQNRPAATLRVADFTREDRLLGRLAAPIKLEVFVADHLDQF